MVGALEMVCEVKSGATPCQYRRSEGECRDSGHLHVARQKSECFGEPGRFGKPFENDDSRSGQSRFARHPWSGRASTATTTSGPEESTFVLRRRISRISAA